MRDDLPEAAVRLSSRLPVVTHTRKEEISQTNRMLSGRKSIRIRGVVYESLSDARIKLKCAFVTLHKLVQAGEAEYI